MRTSNEFNRAEELLTLARAKCTRAVEAWTTGRDGPDRAALRAELAHAQHLVALARARHARAKAAANRNIAARLEAEQLIDRAERLLNGEESHEVLAAERASGRGTP